MNLAKKFLLACAAYPSIPAGIVFVTIVFGVGAYLKDMPDAGNITAFTILGAAIALGALTWLMLTIVKWEMRPRY